ncbi:MAG: Trk family potassium uptake protein [Thermobacillus sp. ZCTH02-B1]|uniref:TrkH family potassium uptake protein n=1 Tax=Thermobacillus sp. ZCTH02-B1 TaxID=1858795 RepID=UPI000B54BC0A|nr:TrkH family potassium uptake protein [Thermobacillus sp. ZCTH02-B1]OUM96210.1 MAG: Trk family potassium uptake protein [Thermobacillus sp. ZCTH02-B1]
MRAKLAAAWSPPRVLAIGYITIILLGAGLLSLPAVTVNGEPLRFVDALFTAVSAVCVTGLAVVDTGTRFNAAGQLIILLLIQVGGLGFMTMATLFALVFKRRITLRERLVLQEAMNQSTMEGIVRLIRRVILYSLTIEAAGTAVLTARFAAEMPPGRAAYMGLFHAVSLFNSAGFDLFGGFRSYAPYVADPVVNITAILLITLGGLGFIVLSDLLECRKRRRLSLHSKVVLATSGVLFGIGAVVIFAFEYANALGPLGWGGKIWASLFQSAVPRSGGVSTLDIGSLRQATQFFLILLMFIGAAPGSTGGGIKVTTFATLVGAVIAMMRGKDEVVLFRFRLPRERIFKALTITMLSLAFVITVTMALLAAEDQAFLPILFETVSAFGTCGLSTGITPQLTDFGKLLLSLTMFAGRIGPLTFAYALRPKDEKELFRYPEGRIIIG